MVVFERSGCQDCIDKIGEQCKVSGVVDLAAVSFSNERAEKVPGEFLWRNVGTVLGGRSDPVVDDERRAFVLEKGF